ncbi:MAG: response regulator, partial [Kofleriaceae bacterium]
RAPQEPAASLTRFGYEVSVAEDGEKGLQLALASKPTVILLDLRMPRMDGHTFLRRFASHGLDTTVVATSADADMEDVIEMMRNGAVDFMKKPWTQSDLVGIVSRAAEISRKKRAAHGLAPVAPAVVEDRDEKETFSKALERLRQGEITIPSVPSVVFELRGLMDDPQVSVQKIATLVERDQRLLTAVLRLGKGACYGGLSKTADLSAVMLSDVGACFLLWMSAEKTTSRGLPDPSAILPLLHEHHVPVGAQLLAKWGYTNDTVLRIARGHHSSPQAAPDRFSSLMVLATDMAYRVASTEDLTTIDPRPSREVVERYAAELGLVEATRLRIAERVGLECSAVLSAIE